MDIRLDQRTDEGLDGWTVSHLERLAVDQPSMTTFEKWHASCIIRRMKTFDGYYAFTLTIVYSTFQMHHWMSVIIYLVSPTESRRRRSIIQ